MKVVILAGGFGTRIRKETEVRPKPLIEIGGMPIILHVMKIYSSYGINDFIICTGYKGDLIKKYFANYFLSNSNVGLDMSNPTFKTNGRAIEPWEVKVIDTGLETMTGGRLKRVKNYLDDLAFCLTYADDLKRVNITDLIAFHRSKKTLATLTTFRHSPKFGLLILKNDKVINFKEKPSGYGRWMNGGYYVLEPEVLDYIKDDSTVFEREPLETLARKGQLSAYRYHGTYQPMDTLQDKNNLEQLWNSGEAYWKVWQ